MRIGRGGVVTDRIAVRLVALVIALGVITLAGACRSAGSKKAEDGPAAFDMVRPPIAFELLRDNPYLPVLDLRSRGEFAGPAGHLRGARNVPLDELPFRLKELSGLRQRTFLVYCGHDDCGVKGLRILREAGFEESLLMDGGIDGWIMAGFGTVTGPPPPMFFPEEDSEEVVVD
jgi:rhodanese-related sulfurtransferase